jgi:hypothetical protein
MMTLTAMTLTTFGQLKVGETFYEGKGTVEPRKRKLSDSEYCNDDPERNLKCSTYPNKRIWIIG